MSAVARDSWKSIIEAVKTPLGFLVLAFLVVDGTVASLAVALTEFRTPLVWTMIASIPGFVLTVVVLAVWDVDTLLGHPPFQGYANRFANDLYWSLDGALRNLQPAERTEAWVTVADVITSGGQADERYATFCSGVAETLKMRANVAMRGPATQGRITQ